MARVRASVPGWIAQSDRVPPAELLDRVIAESAYEFELAGPRARQARENLKKIRALVRRIQNRGYTTLARVTEHLDRLSAGDESNAAFDAVDAVNLMTVHAAKGLEFPVVFLVHLGKGAGGGRDPILLERGDRGRNAVDCGWRLPIGGRRRRGAAGAGGDQAPALRGGDARARPAVFLERPRRPRKAGRLPRRTRRPGRGPLPPDFRQIFVDATRGIAASSFSWASGGAAHRFRVCRILQDPIMAPSQPVSTEQMPFDLQRLGGLDADRASMAATELSERRGPVEAPIASDADARLVGLVVHRLLDRYGVAAPLSADLAWAALRPSQSGRGASRPQTPAGDADRHAVRRYRMLVSRPDVLALFRDGRAWHEVPVSSREAGIVLRGTIDSLVVGPGWPGLGAGIQDRPGQRSPQTAKLPHGMSPPPRGFCREFR